jgi:hypothetical protein
MAIDSQAMLDLLSEVLAVERDGARMYGEFLSDAPEDLRPKLADYAEQNRRSVLVLEEALRRLGGDPAYISPGAEVAHRLTEAVLSATEPAETRRWMHRLLHLVAYEIRDGLVWEALDAIGHAEDGETGEVLRMAATAVLSQEAVGAHGADRNDERIEWALKAMRTALGREFGVAFPARLRRGLRRPR